MAMTAAYQAGNAQHIGSRASQQDAFGFSNAADAGFTGHGGVLAVLADGMGGMAHGDVASRAAVSAFLAEYKTKTPGECIGDALARALGAANDTVCRIARQLEAEGEIGTTLIGAVVHGESLEWVAVGDSGLFLCRDGQFVRLNEFHIYARDLDARAAAGEVTAEEAAADPQRDALTSFVGMEKLAHVDRSVRPLALDPGDTVLLASDGLFKVLPAEEMSRAMHGNLQQRCEALVEAVTAKQAAQQDNVTVLMLGTQAQVPDRMFLPKTQVVPVAAHRPSRAPLLVAATLLAALVAAGYVFRDRLIPSPEVKPPLAKQSPKAETETKKK